MHCQIHVNCAVCFVNQVGQLVRVQLNGYNYLVYTAPGEYLVYTVLGEYNLHTVPPTTETYRQLSLE